MDEQQLQQKEVDLKILENDLNMREADLNSREFKVQQGIEPTILRQEFLRRAVEVGANALQKLDSTHDYAVSEHVFKHIEELIDTAAVKLKAELEK